MALVRTFDMPINTGDQSIDRVLGAGLPVVLVFADKLPTALEAEMKRLASQNAGKLLIAQVAMRDNPGSAKRFQVSQTPAIAVVRNGEMAAKSDGPLVDGAVLAQHVAYALGRSPKPAQPRPTEQPAPARPRTPSAGPRVVTDATFDQEVLRSPEPVLVDFWAPWCGPCRSIEPIVERLAREMTGKLRVAKINVDENPAVAQRFGVQSIPTMMIVKQGRIADRWAGAMPESAIRGRLAAAAG